MFITVPAAGEYTKVPGTFALAFNCEALSAVPLPIAAGVGHVMTGSTPFPFTVSATVAVAVV
jgi:hypothetical protein